jgi:hypothetical protein
MGDIQFKAAYRDKYASSEVSSPDLPKGFYDEWNAKFRAWEERRGLVEKRGGFHYGNQTKKLRGAAARSNKVKKAGFSVDTNIIGKCYATNDSATRAIRRFLAREENKHIGKEKFRVRKVDWGCYKIEDVNAKTSNTENEVEIVDQEIPENDFRDSSKSPTASFLSELEKKFNSSTLNIN